MENELLPTMYVESFFDIAKSLELGERKYVRTDDVAACVAEAYAIVQAEHPDWCYDTFIECFRKDVVDRMAERTEHYLGYKAFADEKG